MKKLGVLVSILVILGSSLQFQCALGPGRSFGTGNQNRKRGFRKGG
jgi:hypothetical protein